MKESVKEVFCQEIDRLRKMLEEQVEESTPFVLAEVDTIEALGRQQQIKAALERYPVVLQGLAELKERVKNDEYLEDLADELDNMCAEIEEILDQTVSVTLN